MLPSAARTLGGTQVRLQFTGTARAGTMELTVKSAAFYDASVADSAVVLTVSEAGSSQPSGGGGGGSGSWKTPGAKDPAPETPSRSVRNEKPVVLD